MCRWVGKTAVVTGASVGIGAAIAVSLADAGLNVVGLARRSNFEEELNKQRKTCKGKICGMKCDVSSTKDVIEVFASINEHFGGINIVVNNAACLKYGTFTGETMVSDKDMETVLKTNTLGLAICCREAAKYMKETGEQGHIVNIGGISAHYVMAALGMPKFNMYYGSKHAVRAITETMRLEFSHSKTNIKITCVSPSGVWTDLAATAFGKDTKTEDSSQKPSSFAFLEPSDVADAVMSVIATPPRVNISDLIIRPLGDTV